MGCSCSGKCTCGSSRPYYDGVSICPNDSVKYVNCPKFHFSIVIPASWNVPEIGGSSTLIIPDLETAVIGSYLWSPIYGYFEIVSVDVDKQEIMIQNNGDLGLIENAPAGTQVPECTGFVITDTPCCSENGGGGGSCDFVAVDFTAPADGASLDITVTAVTGLVIGKTVQIGAGRYVLTDVISDTLITIRNDGDGITPGTPVIAKNTAGEYQYCVTLLDSNPCTNPAVITGSLLVCADGLTQPLDGATPGSIPVLIDATTNEVQFKILGVPIKTCTTLTADLTIVSGTAAYTLVVADSSVFTIGDVLQIGTRTDRLTVTGLPSGTLVQGTLAPVPGATTVVPAGTTLCNVDCCEELQNQIDDIDDVLDDINPTLVAQCTPQTYAINRAVTIHTVPITLDATLSYQVEVDDLEVVELPHACDYLLEAHMSVACLLVYANDADFPVIYAECEIVWDPTPYPTGRTMGKMAWNSYAQDGKDLNGLPVGTAFLPNQLTAPAPELDISYHQADVTAYAYAAGGDTRTLKLFFRTTVGDNFPPADYTEARIMVTGVIKFQRVELIP